MKCPKCGIVLPEDSVFCQYCGCNISEVCAAKEPKGPHCKTCGNEIPEDSCFCQYCGAALNAVPVIEQKPPAPKPTQKAEEKQPKEKKRKRTGWIAVAVALVALIPLVIFAGVPGMRYMQAKNLLADGEYDDAYDAFYNLGSFANAEKLLSETRYQQAVALRNEKDFDKANEIFEGLGNYKDSRELIHYHKYTETVEVKATCATIGKKRMTCSCGHTYTKKIDQLAHHTVQTVTTPSTCTTRGKKEVYCTRCDYKTVTLLLLGSHSYETKVTKAATCTAPGTKKFTCSGCGDSYTEEIAKTAHTYSAATCTEAKTCKACGKTDGSALGHTDTAVCTRCGKALGTSEETLTEASFQGRWVNTTNTSSGEVYSIFEFSGNRFRNEKYHKSYYEAVYVYTGTFKVQDAVYADKALKFFPSMVEIYRPDGTKETDVYFDSDGWNPRGISAFTGDSYTTDGILTYYKIPQSRPSSPLSAWGFSEEEYSTAINALTSGIDPRFEGRWMYKAVTNYSDLKELSWSTPGTFSIDLDSLTMSFLGNQRIEETGNPTVIFVTVTDKRKDILELISDDVLYWTIITEGSNGLPPNESCHVCERL